MCTLTYYPVSNDEWFLTFSRDESIFRPVANHPTKFAKANQALYFPLDPISEGSWFVTKGQNATVCLLNGAFENHIKARDYKHSRGYIPVDFFTFSNFNDFIENYNFSELEPFTLIAIENNQNLCVCELRWDGVKKHVKKHNPNEAKIWSSATLYSKTAQDSKKNIYHKWMHKHNAPSQDDFVSFHETLYANPTDFLNTNMRTVSILCMERSDQFCRLKYRDLLSDSTTQLSLI